jgi:hypothetical protein
MWLGLPVGAGFGALIGLIVSPVAQVGDLAESLLKREAGVKDSGTLLPGSRRRARPLRLAVLHDPGDYWLLSWCRWMRMIGVALLGSTGSIGRAR